MQRRSLLRLLGASTAGALVGCANRDEDGTSGSAPTPTAGPSATDRPTTDTSIPTDTETDTLTAEATESTAGVRGGEGEEMAGFVTVEGGESVPANVSRIETDIEDSPLSLVATVDHAANTASADMDLPPTRHLRSATPPWGRR